MSKQLSLGKISVSNPKVWVVIGVTVAGIVILAETRRRRLRARKLEREDLGAFIERFELLPFPQPLPPAARHLLSGLTFAVKDIFDVKDCVTGFGNPDWKRTHEAAGKTAVVVTALLKNGATCVGKTVMDEFAFGITGENVHYGTPTNPRMPSHIPGGSSSGSAVAVAAGFVDFALGWFARDPSILHRVGHILLQLNPVEPRRTRCFIIADDLFQLSKVPKQKSIQVITRVTENLSGYQPPRHVNFGQYVAANVPSLRGFREESMTLQDGISTLKALSSVMFLLQRYEFKTNHGEWVKAVKPRLASDVADRVNAAVDATHENVKTLYKVRTEMRAALRSLLKDDGILIFPTVADPPMKLNSKKGLSAEFHDRAFALLSIASMSGCCQVTIPFGKHDGCPISVSFLAFHGADKFLLDTVLDTYSSLQEQVSLVSHSSPVPDTNGHMDASELLKEKVCSLLAYL
ncbi:hypothetical protein C3L33_19763, partial [Rhododendron williamsianum]